MTSSAKFDAAQLRAADNLAKLDWLKHDPGIAPRIYYCDCQYWGVASPITLDPLDADLADQGLELPWRCAGHPAPQPGDQLGGLDIAQLCADPDAVRRLALGEIAMADSPRIAAKPGIDLRRLYNVVASQEQADVISLRVADLLDAPEPLARVNALGFFFFFPRAAGAERLLAVAQDRERLFDSIPNPFHPNRTLSRQLDDALERRATHVKDMALITYLRERLLAGKTTNDLLWAVATFDWEWIESNAIRILKADPKQLGPMLMSMQKFPLERILEILLRIQRAEAVTEANMQATCKEIWEASGAKLAGIREGLGWA